MHWRALQEGRVYIKQNFTDAQITVADIQERIIQDDTHMANRIMHFSKGLCRSCQFWNLKHYELTDMIKQIKLQGLIFFTFSAADLHWPELYKLMPLSNNSEASDKTKLQNIIDNSHIVMWFFSKQFEIFFNDILKK
ncbi:hypothetical protein RclHR1_28930001 [Rhizophagus clarus]|uniref:Uncharacterized protein LOC107370453 n=1 Tax=Rhizophagus clarus TaxID=94130 RepID=A0A2Z6RG48_9GLOM|nr:hypothetical protein RclHR1_28930001 [Rhizophagus clarus]GES73391.1 uncharacterized protein LOC107370453 [Rhizophagus clarus]